LIFFTRLRQGALGGAVFTGLAVVLAFAPGASADPALPQGFQDSIVFGGLKQPTAVRFAPNGMVFVAEKAGRIKVYEDLDDESAEMFKDLTAVVYNHGDRGLLGLAVDPGFPTQPYVYALFSYDKVIGDPTPAPKWGDSCPLVPANGADDCVISGRLVRYTAELSEDGEGHLHAVAGAELPLIAEDWCQQFSSHSIGDLRFGPEGALYVGGGDGASYSNADWGQLGNPPNPCGDPVNEGGSLRSQDLITPAPADPTGLNGTIARIDPDTGAGWPTNPKAASADENERRIVAYGLRNPFRFAVDPETNQIYVGNVGSSEFEEIDRFDPSSSSLYNSGWPCYEGANPQFQFKNQGLPICTKLYEEPQIVSPPLFYYSHNQGVMPGDECPRASGSALSGLAFYEGEVFPAAYNGALFFSDSVRNCIYVMFPGPDGRPDPTKVSSFMTGGSNYPGVDIQEGPDGALYYVSLFGEGFTDGAVHRIVYAPGAPSARLSATPRWGELPLEVELDASESTDPDDEALEYEWDLDGNGSFEVKGGETQTKTYAEAKNVVVAVRVTDEVEGLSSVAKLTLYPGDSPPTATITAPKPTDTWGVGDDIKFSGSGKNGNGEPIFEPLFYYWSTQLFHCPTGPEDCHAHPLGTFPGVTHDELTAPEHDYPSYIGVTLTVSDKRGLTATTSVKIEARAVNVKLASQPPGIDLVAGLVSKPTPFDVPTIEGSQLVLSAPETAELNGRTYTWQRWSDGGERAHTIVAAGPSEYTAIYSTPGEGQQQAVLPPPDVAPETSLGKHPKKKTTKTTAKFTFSSSEPGSSFRCKLDRKPFKPCRSPIQYSNLKRQSHVFKVAAVDNSGLVDSTPAKFAWKVKPKS
jgi:glucose/arabinose dehydrogenase